MKTIYFNPELIKELNRITSIEIYPEFEKVKIENKLYNFFGDDGLLKLATNINEEVVGIDIENNRTIYVQRNLSIFSQVIHLFIDISKKDSNDEDKLKEFITFLNEKDTKSLKKSSWWYIFISNSIIDGIDIDGYIKT